jgi:endonuclease/exonuclease/phosphatase family metal-dependent hydrolase
VQGDPPSPLSVLTWNISYEPLQPLGVLPWEQRRERIADAARDADIIALQELSGRQLHDIEQRLAGFEVVTLRA